MPNDSQSQARPATSPLNGYVDRVRIVLAVSEGLETIELPVEPKLTGRYEFHYDRRPTTRRADGRLTVSIAEEPRLWMHHQRRSWRDSEKRTLEERLHDVIIGILKLEMAAASIEEKRDSAAREEAERQRRQRELLDEQRRLRELVAQERARFDALRNQVTRWRESESIRVFVARARERQSLPELGLSGAALEAWSDWALKQADRLDPFTSSPASILDDAERIERIAP